MTPKGPGRGTHSVNLRQYNERMLLQRLRRAGRASKADLARWARLTNTAVGSIVQGLEMAQLIEPAGRRQEGQRGQPASLYRVNPAGAYGIGVRLDRASIETVLIDLSGQMLARKVHDRLLPPPDAALELVCTDVAELLAELDGEQRLRLAGIGLAQPYNLGSWLRELDLQTDFRVWDSVDFGARLSAATGLPVFQENDGNAAAIAEHFFGVGRDLTDFLYVSIGSALGAGVVLGGENLRGATGNAADLGLMPVPCSTLPSAPPSERAWGILLSRASLNALTRHLRYAGLAVNNHAELAVYVQANEPAVTEWLDDCVDALTPALRSAIAVLDVSTIVLDCDIDGGLLDALFTRLDQGLRDIVPEARQTPTLLRGSFRADAGALGAASLPIFFSFSPRTDVLRGHTHTNQPETTHA